ncbi:response regulator transcription factor [Achromobacter pestifer]|uniref:Transcriptional regulatory protein OmpR n=1 Tax=Achromobacter pestifer TaxID=1353889 RepID=A0A6S7A0B6_9BURK|nr:response regulator transcription factor [Achromobacter pestifer]CAB3648603.1 Transcriptional regulatory protein OmpR [Achromobacter pestifer]
MLDVILLEDEPVLRQELGEFLDELGYAPQCVSSLQEFDRHFDPTRHHLAVIDIGLPDGCGLDLIQRLRREGQRVGIVVFSARQTSADRIAGLGLGADHYLGKGCDLDELAATLAALVRRLGLQLAPASPPPPNWTLEVGPRRLLIPGAPAVPLSQQDLLVLRCLMSQPGENISRRHIIEALGFDYLDYDQRRLDTQMRRLRRRVEDVSGQTLPVKTLRNSGYCFYQPAKVLA